MSYNKPIQQQDRQKIEDAAGVMLMAINAILENFPIEVLKDQLNEDYELIEAVIEKLK